MQTEKKYLENHATFYLDVKTHTHRCIVLLPNIFKPKMAGQQKQV